MMMQKLFGCKTGVFLSKQSQWSDPFNLTDLQIREGFFLSDLWVLARTASMRQFLWAPKTCRDFPTFLKSGPGAC